ncbi:hypothetical protein GCM10011369_27900 [Neiella marina]|uniref:Glycosyltransferase n=2 Tax=Neiella marina TaxID=508461 RepID=A0A8J2U7J6_9GAMM|nr:hypothetical protein GCM10011369_27900 [Neiella marina]
MDVGKSPEYRTFKIAGALGEHGIDCQIWLVNYKNGEHYTDPNGRFFSPSARNPNWLKTRRILRRQLSDFNPTHVWFTNGPIVGLVAYLICPALLSKPIIYEQLDNYDTYFPKWLLPFSWMHRALNRRSILSLYVTKELMSHDLLSGGEQMVFPNGFDPAVFKPMEQNTCRQLLGLEEHQTYVGYAGSLDVRVNDNLQQILQLSKTLEVRFAIASNSTQPEWLAQYPNVDWLGGKSISEVATVINACDLMLIPNRQDDFTQYCFPSKLLEYMGCGTPFLITPINSLNGMVPEQYISSFDMQHFVADIERALANPQSPARNEDFSWQGLLAGVVQRLQGIEP